MKTLAYIPLHYGREYLDATIRAINDHVDQILILYTFEASYGQRGSVPNPEKREELKEIIYNASQKIKWIDIEPTIEENIHRKKVFQHASGFDLIFAVDSDEVWHPDYVEPALKAAFDTGYQNVCLGGICWHTLWRSFNEELQDGFYPVRFHNVKGKPDGDDVQKRIIHDGLIYHMGYAQSEAITKYKISVHGHKSISENWYNDKWLNYKRGETKYLHPDSMDYWIETKAFDKTTLPEILKQHPYYNLDIIR